MVRLMGLHRKQSAGRDGGGSAGGGAAALAASSNNSHGDSAVAAVGQRRVRLAPSARSSSDRQANYPMYRYAIREYEQTVAAGTSNDSGTTTTGTGEGGRGSAAAGRGQQPPALGGKVSSSSSSSSSLWTTGTRDAMEEFGYHPGTAAAAAAAASSTTYHYQPPSSTLIGRHPRQQQHQQNGSNAAAGEGGGAAAVPVGASSMESETVYASLSRSDSHATTSVASSDVGRQQQPAVSANAFPAKSPHASAGPGRPYFSSPSYYHHPAAAGSTSALPAGGWFNDIDDRDDGFYLYEESYGDAYTGGPIKYLYPSGYQSMRPRSCPWKISIVVCLSFTWLSVFIVGHCSDQVASSAASEEASYYYGNGGGTAAAYDDKFEQVLQTRWCGSRPLYLLWVTSMLITGLAAAYCGVIGYIKVRDFAIGNMRSQLPGSSFGLGAVGVRTGGDAAVVVGGGGDKSDYYVRIGDDGTGPGKMYSSGLEDASSSVAGTSASGSSNGNYHFRPSIYQSDGTPQFWGAHIYRPTQAAVAVTSR